MSEPEIPGRQVTRRRPRYSVRAMMLIMVALALIFAVLSPLYHVGLPPCLTPVETAVWLVAKPAAASCVDCHDRRKNGRGRADLSPGPSNRDAPPEVLLRLSLDDEQPHAIHILSSHPDRVLHSSAAPRPRPHTLTMASSSPAARNLASGVSAEQ
jgi:hypothetical protein